MKAFVLSLLLCATAFASEKAFTLTIGTPSPQTGVFLPESLAIEQAKRVKECEAEREELRKPPVVLLLVTIALSIGAGVAVGYGIAKTTK